MDNEHFLASAIERFKSKIHEEHIYRIERITEAFAIEIERENVSYEERLDKEIDGVARIYCDLLKKTKKCEGDNYACRNCQIKKYFK